MGQEIWGSMILATPFVWGLIAVVLYRTKRLRVESEEDAVVVALLVIGVVWGAILTFWGAYCFLKSLETATLGLLLLTPFVWLLIAIKFSTETRKRLERSPLYGWIIGFVLILALWGIYLILR